MAQIGFVGLGNMGLPMVSNLIAAGHELTVFDLSEEARQRATELGANAATELSLIAQDVDVIFTMVQTGKQVQSILLGEEGLFSHASQNTLFIDTSSIDVEQSREIARHAHASGFDMIDAPVSGGVVGATNASLTVMVGGAKTAFERAKPYLECLGKNIIHAGDSGNGQAAKICNNMILAISMIGVCEGFNLGEKLGLDPKVFFDIASTATSACWSMTSYCPAPGVLEDVPSSHNYAPGFTANMMLKDLRLSQEAAAGAQATTILGAQAAALYTLFVNQGEGQTDFSGIMKLIHGKN